MRRLLLLAALAACSGAPHTNTITQGTGSGSDNTTTQHLDAALAAREAFANPGGMWMPRQMDLPQHVENFAKLGVALDPKTLTDPLAAPLGAIVEIPGCTGSFVSADGLIITNHHCVQDALQLNSSEKDNLVENGFLAKTRADEKSAGPTAKVLVEQSFEDVTSQVTEGLDQVKDPGKRTTEIEDRQKKLINDCEKGHPELECRVERFFRGAEYQLIRLLAIKDLRLVYVPSRNIGDYGGEVDNWHWPRHTGDWSFYRAYVGKDGMPAAYSTENVPYQPKHFLKVSTEGLRDHDFVMVAGYPGSTERLHTYSEVQNDVDFQYPTLIDYLQKLYDMLDGFTKAGGATAIKAGVFKQGVQNGLALYQGTLKGLTSGDLLERKKKTDADLQAYVAQPGHEAQKAAVDKFEALLADERKTQRSDLDMSFAMSSSLLGNAMTFVRMAEERPKKDAVRKAGFQARDLPDLEAEQQGFEMQYDAAIDRAAFELGLVRALELAPEERPWLNVLVGAKKGATVDEKTIHAVVDKLYTNAKLPDLKSRLALLHTATTKSLRASKDPWIKLAVALRPYTKAAEDRGDKLTGDVLLVAPVYAQAVRDMLGGFLAPDANRTLRVTYGTVRPIHAGEPAFTKLSEIPKKDTGTEPFNAPKTELDAIAAKKWGPYADPQLGEVPADFLTDVDITGGNSGSPTLNERGELVGLAFDGTIEGVASDVVFDSATTRSIHVDIRYCLWVMDALDGADNLLTEMGVTPAL